MDEANTSGIPTHAQIAGLSAYAPTSTKTEESDKKESRKWKRNFTTILVAFFGLVAASLVAVAKAHSDNVAGRKAQAEVTNDLQSSGDNVIGPLESHSVADANTIVQAVEDTCVAAGTSCLPDRDRRTGTYTVALTTEMLAQKLATAMDGSDMADQRKNWAYESLASELAPFTGRHPAVSQPQR